MQQTLPIHLDYQASLQNYYTANDYAKALITTCIDHTQQHKHQLLVGETGSGKSHLLKAICLQHTSKWCYIPCKNLVRYPIEVLHDLDNHLICLDDVEHLLGNKVWEQALFHVMVALSNCTLLMSSAQHPLDHIKLPDLASRLQALHALHLPTLDERSQKAALQQRAQMRGMRINEKMIAYLQQHAPRNNHAIFSILDAIDKHCLQKQKKPTTAIIQREIDAFNNAYQAC